MVDFWKYVWPTELPLQIIIGAIWALAIYVLIRCNGIRLKTSANLKMLEEMQDVSFLENVLKMNNVDVVQCFENFKMAIFNKMKTEGHPINKDTVAPLFEHLKAIYNAGYKSSRLDSDLLVKNTTNKIFRGIDTVRTLISLFLVVGILGTLVGLAMTITSLRVSSSAAGKYTLDLSNLGGAFAPSMWGVFCTIVFVAFFSVLIQEGCINRLTEKLTNSTINTWLPVLYPTDFQKSENSLVKLNETVKNAENINTGAQGLLRNLAESNETVVALREAAKKCDPVILEPVMRVDVTAPAEYLGSVMGDIVKRRGQIRMQEETGNAIKIESYVPLSEMFGYVTDLRSFTQGRGTYIMQTDHYEEVPKNIAKEIIAKNGSSDK